MRLTTLAAATLLAALGACTVTTPGPATAPGSTPAQARAQIDQPARNIIFFVGDGMGLTTLTAARTYAVGEDGDLAIDTLLESAFVKTFSNDSQATDSAAAMSAFMTGVKPNNGVVSMSSDTRLAGRCANGTPVPTLAELAKKRGMAVGVVTNTSITDATPAAAYAHTCNRNMESDIAAAMVPGGAGYNAALGQGLDLAFGGGSQFFAPPEQGGIRGDKRHLLAELAERGYRVATSPEQMQALDPAAGQPVIGLFAKGHMSYDAQRDPAREPGLAEMTLKALDILSQKPNGFFLVVEGGLIDNALNAAQAKRALQETVAFDAALKATIDRMQKIDPGLKNTLIVATGDHDHTLLLNGYMPRTGKTTDTNPGVLGLLRNVPDRKPKLDKDGAAMTVIGFGTGPHRVDGGRAQTQLTDQVVASGDYQQEAAVRMPPGANNNGGTDVYLGAVGANAELFRGTIDNTRVFSLIKTAAGW